MKKLIAISVVFALAAGTAFAVDLGGEVIGTVNVLQGDNADGSKVSGSGSMDRIRLQGEGANDDGTFGGWIRAEEGGFWGNAWWKPIDQLKLWIGSNGGDGFFAKEGNTGWMFYQRASDTGITMGGANVWGWSTYATGFDGTWSNGGYFGTRHAFYGGNNDGQNALYATISPAEIVNINLELPAYFPGGEAKDVFKAIVAQLDFNLSFGNIAITYDGAPGGFANIGPNKGKIFAYLGLSSLEKVALDVSASFTLPDGDFMSPIGAGVGAKVDISDAFSLKARVAASFAGDDEVFALLGDLLPYFTLSDNLKVFASLGVTMFSSGDDTAIGWHVTPYAWIGQEWGPSFWAGIKIWSDGGSDNVNWAVPIAIGVSF